LGGARSAQLLCLACARTARKLTERFLCRYTMLPRPRQGERIEVRGGYVIFAFAELMYFAVARMGHPGNMFALTASFIVNRCR